MHSSANINALLNKNKRTFYMPLTYSPSSPRAPRSVNRIEHPPAIVGKNLAPQSVDVPSYISRLLDNGASAYHSADMVRARIMGRAASLQEQPLLRAAVIWLREKGLTKKPGTIECYRDYVLRFWRTYFKHQRGPAGKLRLMDVHLGHFLQYQKTNKANYHPASINHDLNTLAQMLRRVGLWTAIAEHYQPLPLPERDAPKVMSEKEEDAFFKFAFDNKGQGWELAYSVASLTNNTTASGKELRMLQLSNIFMDAEPPYFQVPRNMKTPHRHRPIPMNEQAFIIMDRLLLEAAKRGSTRQEHYLFPKRLKRNFYDPNQPSSESWLKYRWKKLVDAALAAGVISFRITPHNLRHQAITNLLDNNVPVAVVRKIAGHGVDSVLTWRDYHHGRMEVMARALGAIDPDKKRPAHFSTSKNGKGESA